MPGPAAWPQEPLPWPPEEERRAAPRHPSFLPVPCRLLVEGDEAPLSALLRDVSCTGAGLLLACPVPTRALLHLDFAAATRGASRALLARIVHVTPDTDGWRVGCAFIRELDEAAVGRLGARRVRSPRGDARRWARFPCDVPAVCAPPGGGPTPARVVDASAGGVGLVLPREHGPGSLLCLGLTGEGGATHWELLRVVRAVPRAGGDWFLGCEMADCLLGRELAALYLVGDLAVPAGVP
jgi:hypothetical protein